MLVKPDIHVSTPEAYSLVVPEIPRYSLLELIQGPITSWKDTIQNDFEKSVFTVHPQIKAIKDKFYEMGAIYASMSGSGSSVYGIFLNEPVKTSVFNDCFIASGILN